MTISKSIDAYGSIKLTASSGGNGGKVVATQSHTGTYYCVVGPGGNSGSISIKVNQ